MHHSPWLRPPLLKTEMIESHFPNLFFPKWKQSWVNILQLCTSCKSWTVLSPCEPIRHSTLHKPQNAEIFRNSITIPHFLTQINLQIHHLPENKKISNTIFFLKYISQNLSRKRTGIINQEQNIKPDLFGKRCGHHLAGISWHGSDQTELPIIRCGVRLQSQQVWEVTPATIWLDDQTSSCKCKMITITQTETQNFAPKTLQFRFLKLNNNYD